MTEKNQLDTSVEEVTHAVAEITKMDQVIAGLHQKYNGVIFDVETSKGLKAAKDARKEIREPRYLIENLRKEGKRPILELGRQLDGKAKEMTERLLTLESPVDESIKEREQREERERQEKIEAEQKRVETIQEHISDMRRWIVSCTRFDATAEFIAIHIADLEELEISDERFQEFRQQAEETKAAVLVKLREVHTAAVAREEERRKAAEAQAELDKLRAEQAKRDEEERGKREAAEAEARKKREAEEAKQRAELEAQRKQQAEEQARIDAENKRIADERAAWEREQAEAKRIANEKAEAERKAEAAAKEAARKAEFPGEDAIVSVLAKHFDVPASTVMSWLKKVRKAA